ncbi:pectate lyase [Bacteroides sp. 51]|uniref:pectate lyase n=1 Tax=Bacteroides sp. 51 TaxID=2302938 RepID=UPI0013D2BC79|nr:pectate lyase [Bacteroides sp. 51]NDV81256.1 pectate lyase [Bacteroides sp. 51]
MKNALLKKRLITSILLINALLLSGWSQSKTSKAEALKTMKAATTFLMNNVTYKGGFVWNYLPDFSRQWGEMEAYRTMAWVQPPGTPSVGHLLLDAYHATGDEFYYESAKTVANALIWGQLPCGGWNYMFDFAGENSLKQWYGTIGKQAWRLEEFQHYYGNATFDDAGTIHAAKFLLRMYVEKNDPTFRPAVEKAIRFVLDSQYPIGGWPQRYPLMYDHPFQGKEDYSSFITLNDDVSIENIEFLLQCYQAMGIQDIKEPIIRAMNILIVLQQGAPYAGWADQYTVTDLKPAHARSYEPRAINTSTTVQMIYQMMEYYQLTGESKFIAGIPAAIKFLESIKLPDSELERYGRRAREGYDTFVPRFIDPDTGKPLYVHREGSNVVNGRYYTDQDITNTISHYSSGAFLNIAGIKEAYERVKNTPVNEFAKNSPLLSNEPIPLDKYYSRMPYGGRGDQEKGVSEIIKELTKEGYWLSPLRMISNPYQKCPPMPASNEKKYTATFVGDTYDTSPYSSEETVMGISMAAYIANMMKLIGYLDNN